MFRFTIRDWIWLGVAVVIACGWASTLLPIPNNHWYQ